MKKLLTTIALIGAITIITPGEPTSYGQVDRNGDFRITTPGRGTTYGYNQGDGVTTVIRPGSPTAFIYETPGRSRNDSTGALPILGTEGLNR